jgi:hypothetical protein
LVFWRERGEKRVDVGKFPDCYHAIMARQRILITKGEIFGAALLAMAVMAIGLFPRVVHAETSKATLKDSIKCMQQNPGCTPTPTPPPSE